MDFQK